MTPTVGIALGDYLVDLIPTGDNAHTGDYLGQLATAMLPQYEREFGTTIVGVVSDAAANMEVMRAQVAGTGRMAWRCQAHGLNLLAGTYLMDFPLKRFLFLWVGGWERFFF
jgi:hypothetical protein